MNICQVGHKKHDLIKVDTRFGPFWVYDFEKYKDNAGYYCTGQDDISRTLKTEGVWGYDETKQIYDLLVFGDRDNIVIDIGCHIGWYAILAARLGYKVYSCDGDAENIKVLNKNAKLYNLRNIITEVRWFDKVNKSISTNEEIELVKIDIEGNEQYAFAAIEMLFKNNQVRRLLMEVSPCFNKSYPDLVKKIVSYGYIPMRGEEPFNFNYDFNQDNLLFVRKDLI